MKNPILALFYEVWLRIRGHVAVAAILLLPHAVLASRIPAAKLLIRDWDIFLGDHPADSPFLVSAWFFFLLQFALVCVVLWGLETTEKSPAQNRRSWQRTLPVSSAWLGFVPMIIGLAWLLLAALLWHFAVWKVLSPSGENLGPSRTVVTAMAALFLWGLAVEWSLFPSQAVLMGGRLIVITTLVIITIAAESPAILAAAPIFQGLVYALAVGGFFAALRAKHWERMGGWEWLARPLGSTRPNTLAKMPKPLAWPFLAQVLMEIRGNVMPLLVGYFAALGIIHWLDLDEPFLLFPLLAVALLCAAYACAFWGRDPASRTTAMSSFTATRPLATSTLLAAKGCAGFLLFIALLIPVRPFLRGWSEGVLFFLSYAVLGALPVVLHGRVRSAPSATFLVYAVLILLGVAYAPGWLSKTILWGWLVAKVIAVAFGLWFIRKNRAWWPVTAVFGLLICALLVLLLCWQSHHLLFLHIEWTRLDPRLFLWLIAPIPMGRLLLAPVALHHNRHR